MLGTSRVLSTRMSVTLKFHRYQQNGSADVLVKTLVLLHECETIQPTDSSLRVETVVGLHECETIHQPGLFPRVQILMVLHE